MGGWWVICLPSQCFRQSVCIALDLEYFDCLVRRAGRESSAVVIQDRIMLHVSMSIIVIALRRSEKGAFF